MKESEIHYDTSFATFFTAIDAGSIEDYHKGLEERRNRYEELSNKKFAGTISNEEEGEMKNLLNYFYDPDSIAHHDIYNNKIRGITNKFMSEVGKMNEHVSDLIKKLESRDSKDPEAKELIEEMKKSLAEIKKAEEEYYKMRHEDD